MVRRGPIGNGNRGREREREGTKDGEIPTDICGLAGDQ